MTIELSNFTIKDEYTLGYDYSKIIAGLKKLPALFSEIGKIQNPVDTDKRIIALIFYIGVLSEFENGALHVDCSALAKRYRMKSPSPGMREIKALPRVGFNIDSLRFVDGVIEKKGRIDELAELIVSHADIGILIAIKVFAAACTLGGREYFSQLDFRLLADDASKPYKPPFSETLPIVQMKDVISQERFDFIGTSDKEFILAFDTGMRELGYDFGGDIGSGNCWGRYMVIYSKLGVTAKQVVARIYIREYDIVLRLYFSDIDKHRAYIENAPPHIKAVFTGEHGDCKHCENGHGKDGICKFRKSYTLEDRRFEKCNGVVFEFWKPDMEKLPDYIDLLKEFYAGKRRMSYE